MGKHIFGIVLAVLAVSQIAVRAEIGSVEFDEFRGADLDTSKWTLTEDPLEGPVITPTFDGERAVWQSSQAGAWSRLQVNRSLLRVKGVQSKTTSFHNSATGGNAASGCAIDLGNFSLWMQINDETIAGIPPVQGTIEMTVQNDSIGLNSFVRIPYTWGTQVSLKVLYDVDGLAKFFVDGVQHHQYDLGAGLSVTAAYLEVGVDPGEKSTIDEARLIVDLQDIVLSNTAPSVPEGNSEPVTVTFPENHPCDMPIIVTALNGDSNLTIAPMEFTLTPSKATQVLTITAAEDADNVNGTRIFDLDPHGTNTHAIITASESDNDVPQILVAPGNVSVIEGQTAEVTVSLTEYSTDALITVTSAGTDADLIVTPTSFTLSSGNPNQILTLGASEDLDKLAGTETFTLSSAGLGSRSFSATEIDNDILRVIATPGTATIEGKSNSQGVMVQLTMNPGTPLLLTVTRTSGDADISATGSITLDSSNYNQSTNYIAITASEDGDMEDDSAVFTITGAEESVSFTALALDDDILLTVNKTGSGSVTGDGIHDLDDAPFAITAVPDLGQNFIAWTGPDSDKVADTSSLVTVIVALDDATVTAEFTSPRDDDDSGCNVGSGSLSLLPIVILLAGMFVARLRK